MSDDYCFHCATYRTSSGCGCHRRLEDQGRIIEDQRLILEDMETTIDKLEDRLFNKQKEVNEYELLIIELKVILNTKLDSDKKDKLMKDMIESKLTYIRKHLL